MPGSERQNNMFDASPLDFKQKNNPFSVTSCGRRRNTGTPIFAKAEPRRTIGKGKNFNKVSKDKSATGGAAGGGMTQKGVNEYKRKNPGSKLKTAVTGKVKKGSKAAKRRKSFCARSKGQMKKFPKAAKNHNSRLRQARRRWKC